MTETHEPEEAQTNKDSREKANPYVHISDLHAIHTQSQIRLDSPKQDKRKADFTQIFACR